MEVRPAKPGHFLFTSESVNEGHPDKLCDQVSDSVLDTCLRGDPKSKVACETATKDNMVMVAGEITTQAAIDYDKVVRAVVKKIGFDTFVDDLSSVDSKGLSDTTCEVIAYLIKLTICLLPTPISLFRGWAPPLVHFNVSLPASTTRSRPIF